VKENFIGISPELIGKLIKEWRALLKKPHAELIGLLREHYGDSLWWKKAEQKHE